MKTKKYSNLKKVAIAAMLSIVFGSTLNAQFSNPTLVTVQSGEEVRAIPAGNEITYTLQNPVAGEEYRWVVRGGVITSVVPDNTDGDSLIVDWTTDLVSITVDWNQDLSGTPIGSASGEVIVQARNTGGCYGQVQSIPITMWNSPSAVIDPAVTDLTVCSTDPITGNLDIYVTGAPDGGQSGNDGFSVIYDVEVSDPLLVVSGANGDIGLDQVATSDIATVQIPLPDALINTDTQEHTYTITLKTVQDDFNDTPVVIATEVYTITVYPTPVTGPIQSSSSLTRR